MNFGILGDFKELFENKKIINKINKEIKLLALKVKKKMNKKMAWLLSQSHLTIMIANSKVRTRNQFSIPVQVTFDA